MFFAVNIFMVARVAAAEALILESQVIVVVVHQSQVIGFDLVQRKRWDLSVVLLVKSLLDPLSVRFYLTTDTYLTAIWLTGDVHNIVIA